MAYKAKYYDKKTKTEKVWHESSMIKYTEMVEDPDDNFGELTVVFNNGATYRYQGVSLADYVLLAAGGIDSSNGKTFNKVIKEHGYAYEKIEPMSQDYIDEGLKWVVMKQAEKFNTCFIFGPEDFTEMEFDHFAATRLTGALNDILGAKFIIRDSLKFGNRVVDYLVDVLNVSPKDITIYKLADCESCIYNMDIERNDEFETDEEMDQNMTLRSNYDLGIVHNWETEVTRESKNILRRYIYE